MCKDGYSNPKTLSVFERKKVSPDFKFPAIMPMISKILLMYVNTYKSDNTCLCNNFQAKISVQI